MSVGWLHGHPGPFSVFEKSGFVHDIFGPESLADQFEGFLGCFRRNSGGIGSHIGDQTDRFARSQIDAFIQLLGNDHGFFGGKSELSNAFLLKFAGGKRRQGISFDGFL